VDRPALGLALAALFVLVVGGLIFIGMRQRLTLEIPARTWPEPEPLPSWTDRFRVIGFVGMLVAPLVGLVAILAGASGTAFRAIVLPFVSLYVLSVLTRALIAFRIGLRARKKMRQRQERSTLRSEGE
jgi:hypothetical protein